MGLIASTHQITHGKPFEKPLVYELRALKLTPASAHTEPKTKAIQVGFSVLGMHHFKSTA